MDRNKDITVIDRKYRHIVGVGCSYTDKAFYNEDPNRPGIDDKRPFGKQLAQRLGVTYTNLARPGFSYQSMYYSIMDWLEHNKEIAKDTLVLMGLTHFGRQNFYVEGNSEVHRVAPPHEYSKSEEEWIKTQVGNVSIKEYKVFTDVLYRYLTNLPRQIQNEITLIKSLCFFLKSQNIPFIVIDIAGQYHVSKDYPNWEDYIDEFLFRFPDNTTNWKKYISSYDSTYKWGHPHFEDHKHLSDLIYKYI